MEVNVMVTCNEYLTQVIVTFSLILPVGKTFVQPPFPPSLSMKSFGYIYVQIFLRYRDRKNSLTKNGMSKLKKIKQKPRGF